MGDEMKKERSNRYYHVYLNASKTFPIINITNLDSYYFTLFEPYQRRANAAHVNVNGRPLLVSNIQAIKVYQTKSAIENIAEVYKDDDDGHACTHDAQKHRYDITADVMAEAIRRISKPSDLTSTIVTSNRILGIAVCLISILSLISSVGKTDLLSRIQLGFSSLIIIESMPLALVGKWEWNGFSKLATVVGIALTIALALFTR